jgi:hypothetical protein
MYKRFFSYAHTDLLGFSASMACAVHCAFLPVLLTVSTFGGLKWLSSPVLEIGFIILSLAVAVFALGRNFRKHKHIQRAIQVVAIGFTLILISRFMDHGTAHHILSAIGGVTIATGHILNWHLARKSPCCETH